MDALGRPHAVHGAPPRPAGIADGPGEARKVAELLFRAGADQIKICTTGGVLSPRDDPAHTQFTLAEIHAIVEEAEAHGSCVLAHAQGTEGIKKALRAGVRSIEHGAFLDRVRSAVPAGGRRGIAASPDRERARSLSAAPARAHTAQVLWFGSWAGGMEGVSTMPLGRTPRAASGT